MDSVFLPSISSFVALHMRLYKKKNTYPTIALMCAYDWIYILPFFSSYILQWMIRLTHTFFSNAFLFSFSNKIISKWYQSQLQGMLL